MKLAFGKIHIAMIKKGYAFFTEGDYNLNIIGVRSRDANSNAFNDVLCVLFYTNGRPHLFTFEATTDPGIYWRKNLANLNGTAIVAPGQNRGLWQLGQHQDKYLALVQKVPVKLYRDNNRDAVIDYENIAFDDGKSGINCHHANKHHRSLRVDKWSAGCQVLAEPLDFDVLMALCLKASDLHGNSFSYTLLLEEDLF